MNPYTYRTDTSLADLLRKLADNPRFFSAQDRSWLLTAAADRLDNYGGIEA